MISDAALRSMNAPVDVIDPKGNRVTITGFTENDPLGVGGGFFPSMPTAHFQGGGWLTVSDLAQHYDLATAHDEQETDQ